MKAPSDLTDAALKREIRELAVIPRHTPEESLRYHSLKAENLRRHEARALQFGAAVKAAVAR